MTEEIEHEIAESENSVIPDESEQTHQKSINGRRVSRAPHVAWLFALIILSLAVVAVHGYGLHALASFTSLQEQWKAEDKQRQSVRNKWNEYLATLRQDVELAEQEVAELRGQKIAASDETANAVNRLEQLTSQLAIFRKTLESEIGRKETASRELKFAQADRGKVETEKVALLREQSAIKASIQELSSDQDLLRRSRTQLTQTVKEMQSHSESLKAEVATYKGQLASVHKRVADDQATVSSLLEQQMLLKRDVATLEGRKVKADQVLSEAKEAQAELISLQAKLKNDTAQLARAQQDLKELEDELKRERSYLEDTRSYRDKEIDNWLKAKKEAHKAAGQSVGLKKEVELLRERHKELSSDVNNKKTDLVGLKTQIDKKRTELKALEAGSPLVKLSEKVKAVGIQATTKSPLTAVEPSLQKEQGEE